MDGSTAQNLSPQQALRRCCLHEHAEKRPNQVQQRSSEKRISQAIEQTHAQKADIHTLVKMPITTARSHAGRTACSGLCSGVTCAISYMGVKPQIRSNQRSLSPVAISALFPVTDHTCKAKLLADAFGNGNDELVFAI